MCSLGESGWCTMVNLRRVNASWRAAIARSRWSAMTEETDVRSAIARHRVAHASREQKGQWQPIVYGNNLLIACASGPLARKARMPAAPRDRPAKVCGRCGENCAHRLNASRFHEYRM